MSASVGILGGSFDPPHVGHIAMAETARDALALDKVLLMPAPHPPHKDERDLTDWDARVEMARLAVGGVEGIEVSRHEIDTRGASYTVKMLRRYRELYDDEIYFILGADSLRDLPKWREPQSILELATIVVFPRDDIAPVLKVQGDASVVVFEQPVIEVSSSDIREKRRRGERIASYVPPAVHGYILDHSLYTR
jgi:nicotinate-nucleotide adenylyltransferase